MAAEASVPFFYPLEPQGIHPNYLTLTMPTLIWQGKDKILNHHLDVPFRVLEPQYTVGTPPDDGGNRDDGPRDDGSRIIHGDNLEALKALLPHYEGRVKCIYIDPPYNTGNEGWIYNDNVSDPKLKRWLGKVVGKESEDLSRHDKWLCMMYPRLVLLHKLLAKDGVIVVSIDENEYASLKLIFDEIFAVSNLIGTVVWKNANDNNPTNIVTEHEYILVYAKDKKLISPIWKSTDIEIKQKLIDLGDNLVEAFDNETKLQKAYSRWFKENKPYIWPFQDYKFIDQEGIYTGSRSVHNPGKEGYRYDVLHPTTGKPCQQPMMGYRFPPETMQGLLNNKRIIFGDDENKIVEIKLYVKDYRAKLSSLIELDGRMGTNSIKEIFPESKRPFDYPKPYSLLEELLSFITSENDIILDSFAGSGTTAHAVLNLNKLDGGNRKFILVEMEDYAETITAERVRRVINGYSDKPGTGGSFTYYELGETVFTEDGLLNENLPIDRIREYVWYSETRTALPRSLTIQTGEKGLQAAEETPHFLGKLDDTAYYFYYEPNALTTLDYEFLTTVRMLAGQYVIYADNCLIAREWLQERRIIFKKIPRDISRL